MTKIFIPIKWEHKYFNSVQRNPTPPPTGDVFQSLTTNTFRECQNDESIKLAVDFEKKSIPYLIRRRANFICVQFTKNLLSLLKCIDHTAMNIGSSVNYQNN